MPTVESLLYQIQMLQNGISSLGLHRLEEADRICINQISTSAKRMKATIEALQNNPTEGDAKLDILQRNLNKQYERLITVSTRIKEKKITTLHYLDAHANLILKTSKEQTTFNIDICEKIAQQLYPAPLYQDSAAGPNSTTGESKDGGDSKQQNISAFSSDYSTTMLVIALPSSLQEEIKAYQKKFQARLKYGFILNEYQYINLVGQLPIVKIAWLDTAYKPGIFCCNKPDTVAEHLASLMHDKQGVRTTLYCTEQRRPSFRENNKIQQQFSQDRLLANELEICTLELEMCTLTARDKMDFSHFRPI